MKNFGDLVTEQRLSLGMSIREFCLKNNINSVVLSKIERNIQLPRKGELSEFVEALKIYEGSAEHAELMKAYDTFSPTQEEFSVKSLPIFFKSDVDPEKLLQFLKESDNPEDTALFGD
jgi:transcriptional regulator with XRE-family HTH domain